MQSHKKYSLKITISSLFIFIVFTLGVILSWQSFNRTSDIMLESADELYERITAELSLDLKATYGSIVGGLRQFRLSPVIHAATFQQRIANLPAFEAVLASDPAIFAVGIGYENGDYLGVSRADSAHVRARYRVPDDADYVALYIKNGQAEPGFSPARLYKIYYDGELNEIGRSPAEDSSFDPRLRPWYQQATDEPTATSPYLFYDSKIVGLTAMSKTAEPGAIVVFDITLDSLGETIARHQLTPGSEVVLINADGQTFAYEDQEKVVMASGANDGEKLELANLEQLDSDVLAHVGTFIKAEEQDLDFYYDGQRWLGSARVVASPGGVDLFALILSPVDELLVDAIIIRDRLITSALFILLISVPVVWYTAGKISRPLQLLSKEAESVSRFNFDETDKKRSSIKEVAELDSAMHLMKSTINKFISLINSLAGEQNLDALLENITQETMMVSKSDAALIYLMDERDDLMKADFLCDKNNERKSTTALSPLSLQDAEQFFNDDDRQNNSRVIRLNGESRNKLRPLLEMLGKDELTAILLPLRNRNDETIGLLSFVYYDKNPITGLSNVEFIEALAGFAAVTLESRQLFKMQEALLHAFIKLIAGAIDAKSPYTGGHCQRVPEITLMLARAACASSDEKFSDFDLDDKQWEELSIACWLHDCGKVTTPEYVVDKATKLETIHDRIHEVRTRFEVLKRDAGISCWQNIAGGADKEKCLTDLDEHCKQLDDDFAFVAECNLGGEFLGEDKIERLQTIAARTWQRTIDDRLGLSWEELNRKQDTKQVLPVEEKLLADKAEHLIAREEVDRMPADNQWGFKVDTPQYKYNRGELYNLSVQRGTLSEEERYMINGHMIQTIIMLNNLPYPKSLRNVPLIAGSHHETMDGSGYPKRLLMSEQPLTARMMVIADIFEALTASDRPYKQAKTLSESLRILSFMRNDKHIDADLFDLFLTSGVYLQYAEKFLSPDQIDEVAIEDYLS